MTTQSVRSVKFWTRVINGQPRWVYTGCWDVFGYLEFEDAVASAKAQITGQMGGRLATQAGHRVPAHVTHAYYRQHIEPLASKGLTQRKSSH